MPIQERMPGALEGTRKGSMINFSDEHAYKRWARRLKAKTHKAMLADMMLEREAERQRRAFFSGKTRAWRVPIPTYYHQANAKALAKAKEKANAARKR